MLDPDPLAGLEGKQVFNNCHGIAGDELFRPAPAHDRVAPLFHPGRRFRCFEPNWAQDIGNVGWFEIVGMSRSM